MSFQHFRLPVHVVAALALASMLALPPASAAASDAPVPATLLLNTTLRHAAIDPEPGATASSRFRIDIPQAGLLALDVTLAGDVQPEPVLRLLGSSLPTGVRATPTALLVENREAVTLLVEVAALESAQSLPAFKLRSAFREADSETDTPIIDEVDPWDDDLGGKKPPGSGIVGDVLCALEEHDDHGDVLLCATPIDSSRTVTGVLHNEAGDDEDLFLVRLPATAVLEVEAVSGSALQLVLRDGGGLAVAVTQSEGGGAPLRLTRALAAGRYFLEVEGLNGDDAEYALTLHRPSRR